MKLRFAKWMLLSLFPLSGAAQTLPSLAPADVTSPTPLVDELLRLDSADQSQPALLMQGEPVVPIWSSASGQLLAVVALPQGWNGLPANAATLGYGGPSTWQLADHSMQGGGGLRWQFGRGFHADAALGQYSLGQSLASAPATCTAAHCGISQRWTRSSLTGSLGLGWTAADGGLDLSYGLSWLQSQSSGTAIGPLAGDAAIPVLTLPGLNSYALSDETSLYASGRWRFGEGSGPAINLAASYGRGRLSAFGAATPLAAAPDIDLDQLSLSLGLDAGSLRGAIVGHVVRSDDPIFAGKRWTTLDLGVSWRTPWAGELSVGAQNLLNTPIAAPRDADPQQSRTPYIQYRQDL